MNIENIYDEMLKEFEISWDANRKQYYINKYGAKVIINAQEMITVLKTFSFIYKENHRRDVKYNLYRHFRSTLRKLRDENIEMYPLVEHILDSQKLPNLNFSGFCDDLSPKFGFNWERVLDCSDIVWAVTQHHGFSKNFNRKANSYNLKHIFENILKPKYAYVSNGEAIAACLVAGCNCKQDDGSDNPNGIVNISMKTLIDMENINNFIR